MGLNEYRRKRDFERTEEPAGDEPAEHGARYLIQKHAASRLHYDFRLEMDGVLKSWAVPKGPSLDPQVKSLAVHVEDHPIAYGSFEGVIPQGEYGGGTVMLWDRGTWEPEGDARKAYQQGKLVFRLAGERLQGRWTLIRMGGKAGQDGKNWLLKKLADDHARSSAELDIRNHMTSVASGRTMEEIGGAGKASGTPGREGKPSGGSANSNRPDTLIRKASTARAVDPSTCRGARRASLPARIAPELPLLVEQLPRDAGWLYELKLDGYRMICVVNDGDIALYTRRGNNWTPRFPTIVRAVKGLGLENAILDGEIVALKKDGTTDFQALQNILRHGDDRQLVFFVFDLLYDRGHDLRQVALIDRKQLLARILGGANNSQIIRYNDHITGHGDEVFSSACGHGLEGIVAKRADSHYTEGRTSDWVKVKCLKRQEFIIGGWTEPGGARQSLGALLVGHYRTPSELVYCGRVGTGFTRQSLRELHQALHALKRARSPFVEPPSGVAARGVIHWAEPEMIAEIAFAAWTDDGILRHASFQGIREDKNPREIRRERPVALPATPAASAPNATDVFAGVRLSHPDRLLFPDEKITKRDLAAYYTAVAPWILPHIVGRPLSLLRCPDGTRKTCFYQKHLGTSMPAAVRGLELEENEGTATSIVIDDLAGLISLVQLGVLEIHPWGSREDQLDHPDRLIIDLDPAEDLAWDDVVRAGRHVKERLDSLGLESFVRTTGGKGLHVVVPIARRSSWDELKTFARAFADALVRDQPARYIAQASKAKRPGKIYVDYLRNERGATAIASYSTRARRGATVATPLSWAELSVSLRPERLTIQTVPERLRTRKADPWEGFFEVRQRLTNSMLAKVANDWTS